MKTPLYDEALKKCDEFRKDLLKKSIIFKIDNVADYIFCQLPKDKWSLKEDFPNIAPPFEIFWMEYNVPKYTNINGNIEKTPKNLDGIFGFLVAAQELSIDDAKSTNTNAKWVLNIKMFYKRTILGERGFSDIKIMKMVGVKSDGTLATVNYNGEVKDFITTVAGKETFESAIIDFDDIKNLGTEMTFPVFLSLSFLHCKNVEIVENNRGRKKTHNKNREYSDKVYTLKINPIRKILDDTAKKHKTGIKQALHICRGHFKDYSKGGGLFGKYKGTYWWPSYVRGNDKYGTIDKSYEINTE